MKNRLATLSLPTAMMIGGFGMLAMWQRSRHFRKA